MVTERRHQLFSSSSAKRDADAPCRVLAGAVRDEALCQLHAQPAAGPGNMSSGLCKCPAGCFRQNSTKPVIVVLVLPRFLGMQHCRKRAGAHFAAPLGIRSPRFLASHLSAADRNPLACMPALRVSCIQIVSSLGAANHCRVTAGPVLRHTHWRKPLPSPLAPCQNDSRREELLAP